MQYIVTIYDFEKHLETIEDSGPCGIAFQLERLPIQGSTDIFFGVSISNKTDDFFFDLYPYENKPADLRLKWGQIRNLFLMIARKEQWWSFFKKYHVGIRNTAEHYKFPLKFGSRVDVSKVAERVCVNTSSPRALSEFLKKYGKGVTAPLMIKHATLDKSDESMRGVSRLEHMALSRFFYTLIGRWSKRLKPEQMERMLRLDACLVKVNADPFVLKKNLVKRRIDKLVQREHDLTYEYYYKYKETLPEEDYKVARDKGALELWEKQRDAAKEAAALKTLHVKGGAVVEIGHDGGFIVGQHYTSFDVGAKDLIKHISKRPDEALFTVSLQHPFTWGMLEVSPLGKMSKLNWMENVASFFGLDESEVDAHVRKIILKNPYQNKMPKEFREAVLEDYRGRETPLGTRMSKGKLCGGTSCYSYVLRIVNDLMRDKFCDLVEFLDGCRSRVLFCLAGDIVIALDKDERDLRDRLLKNVYPYRAVCPVFKGSFHGKRTVAKEAENGIALLQESKKGFRQAKDPA